MSIVNITSLNKVNETYQKDFMVLPYALLIPTLQELKISMLEVNNKDVVVVKERKGGLARPYVAGTVSMATEIARLKERALQTYDAYAALKDNVKNYRAKNVLFDAASNKVNNKTKQHPLERDIITDQIIVVAEDIVDSLFFAERDVSDLTPMGMANGFNTLIDALVSAGDVSTDLGNLVSCGALTAPINTTDLTAFNSLKTWLRNVDQKIRGKQLILYIPNDSLINVKDALENKKTSYKDVNFDSLLTQLREDCMLPNLQIVSHYALGAGDRLILTEPGNLDLGMNTFSDAGFVQVRNPYEDPNEVQFWMQWEIGMRIKNIHKRGFMVSDGTVTSNPLSGDYDDSGSPGESI
jgi:hypothetical protein